MTELDDLTLEQIEDKNFFINYMNECLAKHLDDEDYTEFCNALELAASAQYNIKNFSIKTGITRSQIYQIFRGITLPRIDVLMKILKTLGYSIKII